MIAQLIDQARPARRRESGAAAIEFGLVAPVLILLVFGIMSFGILFAQTLALHNAARQGARFGAVGNRTCTELISETRNSAATVGIVPANVQVQVLRGNQLSGAANITTTCSSASAPANTACNASAPTENVYVRATYQSRLLIPLFFTSNSFTVGGTGAFKCEYQ